MEKYEQFYAEYKEQFDSIAEILGRRDHRMFPMEIETIIQLVEDAKYDWAVVKEAFRVSDRKGASVQLRYACMVLDHWNKAGVKSIEDALAYEARTEKKRGELQETKRRKTMRYNGDAVVPEPHYTKRGLIELKPCPFCGCEDIVVKNQYSVKHKTYYTLVECSRCGANTRTSANFTGYTPEMEEFWQSDSVKEVAGLWNTRVHC